MGSDHDWFSDGELWGVVERLLVLFVVEVSHRDAVGQWVSDVYPWRAVGQGWGEVEDEGHLPEDEAQIHAVNRVPDSHDGVSVNCSLSLSDGMIVEKWSCGMVCRHLGLRLEQGRERERKGDRTERVVCVVAALVCVCVCWLCRQTREESASGMKRRIQIKIGPEKNEREEAPC